MTRTIAGLGLVGLLALAPQESTTLSVALSLSLDKPTFMPGEPFAVHLTIANESAGAILVPAALEARFGLVEFLITRPDGGDEQPFRPWAVFENPSRVSLAPGARRTESSRIFFGAEGWTFEVTGRYRVRARLGEQVSPPLDVVIVPPQTSLEREQSASLIRNPQAGMFLLLDGGDHLDDGLGVLRAIATTNTAFAGYAFHALGTSQSVRFSNLRTGEVRQANAPEAQRLLERARVLMPSEAWYFRAKVVERLDASLRSQGRADMANQLQANFRAEIATAKLSSAMRDQIQRAAIIRR